MSDDKALVPARGGEVVSGFGEVSQRHGAETAAVAAAEREKAMVQAHFIMAARNPRDIEQFRVKLLADCRRFTFAETAMYELPARGEGQPIIGPSIRFVEAALRALKNVNCDIVTVYDTPSLRIVKVTVTDLQEIINFSTEVQVQKVIERRGQKDGKPPKGREVISSRLNSYGDKVYTVVATDDEVMQRQGVLVSKAIRNSGLRLLPGDIVEEAIQVIRATYEAGPQGVTLAERIRKMIDTFSSVGITVDELRAWHDGKELQTLTPANVSSLGRAFIAITKEGVTWDEIMASKNPSGSTDAAAEAGRNKMAAAGSGQPTTDNHQQQQKSGDTVGVEKQTGDGKPEASTSQPATSATGTASAPTSGFINDEQVDQILNTGIAEEELEQLLTQAKLEVNVRRVPADYFKTVLGLAKSIVDTRTKGGKKK